MEGAGVEVELDQRHFAQAFDEMLRSGQLDPIEQMAIAKALEAKGYGGMVDVIGFGGSVFQCESPRGNQRYDQATEYFLQNSINFRVGR